MSRTWTKYFFLISKRIQKLKFRLIYNNNNCNLSTFIHLHKRCSFLDEGKYRTLSKGTRQSDRSSFPLSNKSTLASFSIQLQRSMMERQVDARASLCQVFKTKRRCDPPRSFKYFLLAGKGVANNKHSRCTHVLWLYNDNREIG